MILVTETILFTEYSGRMSAIFLYNQVLFLYDIFNHCENEGVSLCI